LPEKVKELYECWPPGTHFIIIVIPNNKREKKIKNLTKRKKERVCDRIYQYII